MVEVGQNSGEGKSTLINGSETHGQPGLYELYAAGVARCRRGPGPAGAGAVLKAPDGKTYQNHVHLEMATKNEATYVGLILGLGLAYEQGAYELIIFTSSFFLEWHLRGRFRINALRLRFLKREARKLLEGFAPCGIYRVADWRNREAEELAKMAAGKTEADGRLGGQAKTLSPLLLLFPTPTVIITGEF